MGSPRRVTVSSSLSPNIRSRDRADITTIGTTGSPKGVLREAGGHAVGLNFTMPYIFGIRGPGDVMFTASDIGWVVGSSYIVYGPLLAGAATVLYEGKPVGTPDASAFWRVVERYRVNCMFTAPTALRAIKREDPESEGLAEMGARGGLRSLRALFLAGERSEPSLIDMYQELLAEHAARDARVVDNWVSTPFSRSRLTKTSTDLGLWSLKADRFRQLAAVVH